MTIKHKAFVGSVGGIGVSMMEVVTIKIMETFVGERKRCEER